MMPNDSLINKTYNLLNRGSKRNFAKTYIFACQHILKPREKMFSLFIKSGIPKHNIFIVGKTYSTNSDLFHELISAGYHIYQPQFNANIAFDEQHKINCEYMFSIFKKTVPERSRVIVLDDGGALLSEFNKRFNEINKTIIIFGIEQTSSGFRILEKEQLNFPIINVARSPIKLTGESPFIAEICIDKLFNYLIENQISNCRFLIIGLGPIGQSILDELHQRRKEVFGFDIALGHNNLMGQIERLKPNIIIGATGTEVISNKEIEFLNSLGHNIYLINVASSDREFPVAFYRIKNNTDIHSDVRYGNIVFVNNGFPINFCKGHFKGSIDRIEKTICLLLGSVLYLIYKPTRTILPKGFIDVPEKITNIL